MYDLPPTITVHNMPSGLTATTMILDGRESANIGDALYRLQLTLRGEECAALAVALLSLPSCRAAIEAALKGTI